MEVCSFEVLSANMQDKTTRWDGPTTETLHSKLAATVRATLQR